MSIARRPSTTRTIGSATLTTEHPADFFYIAEPERHDMRGEADYYARPMSMGPVEDMQTGQSFTPYSLGPELDLDGLNLCLNRGLVFRHSEPDQPDADPPEDDSEGSQRDLSFLTRVQINYVDLSGALCGESLSIAPSSLITVRSFASESEFAAAARDEVKSPVIAAADSGEPGSRLVDFNLGGSRTAYVAANGDGTSVALVDIDGTTVLITGAFVGDTVRPVLESLEAIQ